MSDSVNSLVFLVLIAASYADIRNRRIPNLLTYAVIAITFSPAVFLDWHGTKEPSFFQSFSPVTTTPFPSMELKPINREPEFEMRSLETYQVIAGATGCFAILLLTYVVGGIGGGDVKLGAFVGAATGLETGMLILCISHLLAGVFATLCLGWNALVSKSPLTCLAAASSPKRSKFSSLLTGGIPMAVFYLLGTLVFAWSLSQ